MVDGIYSKNINDEEAEHEGYPYFALAHIYLRQPKAVWNMPVMKVAVKIKWRYNVGFSIGDTTSPIVSLRSNEQAATVPTARCFESPKMA